MKKFFCLLILSFFFPSIAISGFLLGANTACTPVKIGGLGVTESVYGVTANYTVAQPTFPITVTGTLYYVKVRFHTSGGTASVYVFRDGGTSWTCVGGEAGFSVSSTGVLTFTLTTPIAVQSGDFIGLHATNAKISCGTNNTAPLDIYKTVVGEACGGAKSGYGALALNHFQMEAWGCAN